MNNSTNPKRAHPKPGQSLGRFPQGFIAELDAPASDFVELGPIEAQSPSAGAESSPSTQRGTAVFRLKASPTSAVKLAADFTGWAKRPLDLILGEGDTWEITVALPPGRYAYRFLVDNEWYDDPQCAQREANPFGTFNAVIEVS
jgi:1,4-alpha-glucan branching enzyme